MNDFELGYICGIIDGEGSLCVSKKKNPRNKKLGYTYICSLEVTMCDRTAVEYLNDKIGMGCLGAPIKRKTTGTKNRDSHKYVHKYQLQGNGLVELLGIMKDRLMVKREQADIITEVMRLKNEQNTDRKAGRHRHIEKIHELYLRNRFLNSGFKP